MAAQSRPDPTTSDTLPPAAVVDRRQWWADVQTGVSDLLTAAAHPADQRLAG